MLQFMKLLYIFNGYLRRLYDWVIDLAAHPHAIWWLAMLAFCESIFFPIPQDIMMIPMILAARTQAFKIAFVAVFASVAGGTVGYLLGFGLYETIGSSIIEFYGYGDRYNVFQSWYNQWGEWIVAIGAFTPIPYKVITIASGAANMDFINFMAISFIGRGIRFFLLAILLWYYGKPIRSFIERHFGKMSILFFMFLAGGFAVIKFI